MNYAQAEESAGKHLFSDGPAQTEWVQARSKPVAIKTLFDPETGEVKGFRVTGTVRPGGKQQKMVCATLEDAQAQQEIWETQRIHGAAAARHSAELAALYTDKVELLQTCWAFS